MSSFNVFGAKAVNYGGHTPIWLGVVNPIAGGATLVDAYSVKGMLIPAGTPVYYDAANKAFAPFFVWKVKSVNTTTHAITVYDNGLCAPAANDVFGKVGSTLATKSASAKASSVALDSDGNYVITMSGSQIDDVTANSFIAISSASAAGTTTVALKYIPNGYLYNDIYMDEDDQKATGAIVNFHGEGLLIERTCAAGIADLLPAAIPNVILVKE